MLLPGTLRTNPIKKQKNRWLLKKKSQIKMIQSTTPTRNHCRIPWEKTIPLSWVEINLQLATNSRSIVRNIRSSLIQSYWPWSIQIFRRLRRGSLWQILGKLAVLKAKTIWKNLRLKFYKIILSIWVKISIKLVLSLKTKAPKQKKKSQRP